MTSARGEVLIRVRDDALIVANDGKPVSRIGVLSLCAPDLTEKSRRDRPRDYPGVPDDHLLREIARRTVQIYQIEPNRQTRDVRHEEEVRNDHGGRYFWELIQNADDAQAPDAGTAAELIGTKGLGFISVLDVTDEPAVFSRPFALYFSSERSKALLKKHIALEIRAPTFEIPHAIEEPAEIAGILNAGYATAIRLPFRDGETAASVRKLVENLEYRFLLMSQHIKRLRIETPDLQRTIEIGRTVAREGIEEAVMTVSTNGAQAIRQRWTKWSQQWEHEGADKRLSVAVCLPQNADGKPKALDQEDTPPVYLFFPTDETIGARAIVHASLEIMQNRKHFREGERNVLVYPRMRELISAVLADVSPEVALDAFGGVDPDDATAGAQELAAAVSDTVAETAFVPTIGNAKVLPREVKLWTGRFGTTLRARAAELVPYKLLHPSIEGRNAILEGLGAKRVQTSEFFTALRYCRNRSLAECERVIEVLAFEGLPMIGWGHYVQEAWFDQIPCWWTDAGAARSLAGRPLLFERPSRWPTFVKADALAARVRDCIEATEKRLSSDAKMRNSLSTWKHNVVAKFVQHNGYLEHALMPAMSAMTDDDWDANGWAILAWYREWSPSQKFDDVAGLPIIPDCELKDGDKLRQQLSRRLRVPTGKGWRPAEECYADRSWGAPRSFRSFFKTAPNRAVMRPLYGWKPPLGPAEDAEVWKGLLRFAGVSWEPKLVSTNGLIDTGSYRSEHLSEFGKCDFDLAIEHFPACLRTERSLPTLVAVGQRLQETALRYPAKYAESGRHRTQTLKTNYVLHQLRVAEWLPHRKSILFPGSAVSPVKAYLPSKGIEGLLPEIALGDADPELKNEIQAFLKSIGINDKLPKDGWEWLEWMKLLVDAANNPEADKGLLFGAANTLYRKFFLLQLDSDMASPRLRVPCFVGGDTTENLDFLPTRDARWIDDPIFDNADIRRELLARGYPLFILSMSQANDADLHLGIARLSKHVVLEPISGGLDEEGTREALARYQERLRALRAFVREPQRGLLREDQQIEATPHLSISIRTREGAEIATTAVRAFKNRYGTLLISGQNSSYLRGLGLGLARHVIGNPRLSPTFETILSAENDEEVIERLRDQAIPEQELDAVMDAMAREVAPSEPDTEEAEDETPATRPAATPAAPSPTQHAVRLPHAPTSGGGGGAWVRTVTAVPVLMGSRAYVAPSGSTSTVRSSGGWFNQQAAADLGRQAEDWLDERLRAAFPDGEIVRYARDAMNRESDFVLHWQGRELHIETKRVGTLPGYVYWTELEFAKAADLGENYCLAVVRPSGQDYEVSWSWNPASDFHDCERYVEWTWDRATELLQPGDWQIPSQRPSMQPRSFSYRITLNLSPPAGMHMDGADLALLRNRIANLAAADKVPIAGGR